mgnify:CR=1 FL=1
MKSNLKFFKNLKSLPVDKFLQNVLYDKKNGYYNSKIPFGVKGDFITSPKISNLFSEMISIWIISTWEFFGKPKKVNIIELGPGDGSFAKIFLKISRRFPEFNASKKIYLFETSVFLKKIQKEKIKDKQVKWIKNLKSIKNGPVIFFGNEFFDAIPIKQFKREEKILYEKFYFLQKNYKIKELFKKASKKDIQNINSFNSLNELKFIEFPKTGFIELKKMIRKISNLRGCILLIDYGYLKSKNQNTLQSVFKHKKNSVLRNLGKADITSHINFNLLDEFFLKNGLKIKKTVTQREFLQSLGINKRAEIISKKMKFSDQANLYLRLKRLLSPLYMGNLFKVKLAYKFVSNKFFGFE